MLTVFSQLSIISTSSLFFHSYYCIGNAFILWGRPREALSNHKLALECCKNGRSDQSRLVEIQVCYIIVFMIGYLRFVILWCDGQEVYVAMSKDFRNLALEYGKTSNFRAGSAKEIDSCQKVCRVMSKLLSRNHLCWPRSIVAYIVPSLTTSKHPKRHCFKPSMNKFGTHNVYINCKRIWQSQKFNNIFI